MPKIFIQETPLTIITNPLCCRLLVRLGFCELFQVWRLNFSLKAIICVSECPSHRYLYQKLKTLDCSRNWSEKISILKWHRPPRSHLTSSLLKKLIYLFFWAKLDILRVLYQNATSAHQNLRKNKIDHYWVLKHKIFSDLTIDYEEK